MIYTRRTSGDPNVDKEFDRVYKILNKFNAAPSTATVTSDYIITTEGGLATKFTNGSGYTIPKGYLVRHSDSANRTVIVADEDDYDILGVSYNVIPHGTVGYIVLFGPCDVYFNSNGATRRHYFRMSKTSDTGNTDTGKAQSDSIVRIDTIRMLGFVCDSLVGEGLTRCIKRW